ncbi:sugar dehydrogenase complex small subunit [Stenotrophomonas sp. TWI700]|uniref:sugar dehydrogenase complex small subunit n=1 Tax=Stenotrophomonas sp. TWI700 TaxID=3136792 RepID=UPI003208EBC1
MLSCSVVYGRGAGVLRSRVHIMSIPEGLDENRRAQGLTRRGFLLAVGSASLLAACGDKAPPVATAAATPPAAKADTAFLDLSHALTGKTDLDPATADRIEKAFAQLQPELHAHFPALATLAGQVSGATALVAAAGEARPAALAIITAWYTGTVGKGVHAVTVSYRDALMQRCVDDGLSPPTYVQGGPAWWTAAPPAPIRAHA